MRTTVTLDDDLAIRLERLSQEQGRSFKSVINEAVRSGLEVMQRVPAQRGSVEGGESQAYTLVFDLGAPLYGEILPSRILADLDETEDISGIGGADVPD